MKKLDKAKKNVKLFGILLIAVIYICSIILGKEIAYNNQCTDTVVGTCCSVSTHRFNDEMGYKYCPTYEYKYNGQTYYYCDDIYKTKYYKIGETTTLKINPNNPEQVTRVLTEKTLICCAFIFAFSFYEFLAVKHYLNTKKELKETENKEQNDRQNS